MKRIGALLILGACFAQMPCAKLVPLCRSAFLGDYSWDGRYWRAELYDGEQTEVYYTFFRGLRYRLIPCGNSSEKAGLAMRIYDANRTLLIDTGTQGEQRSYWELELSSTQLLIIQLYYPRGDGCAALLIGHKAANELASQN